MGGIPSLGDHLRHQSSGSTPKLNDDLRSRSTENTGIRFLTPHVAGGRNTMPYLRNKDVEYHFSFEKTKRLSHHV